MIAYLITQHSHSSWYTGCRVVSQSHRDHTSTSMTAADLASTTSQASPPTITFTQLMIVRQALQLFQDTKEIFSDRVFQLSGFLASFIICQVLLKVVDTNLAIASAVLEATGLNRTKVGSMVLEVVEWTQSLATEVRREGARMNGTERVRRMEEVGLLRTVVEETGVLGLLGLGVKEENSY